MNVEAPSQGTPALVRDLLIDVKDLARKELEVAKLHARDELVQAQRRVFYGAAALGMALVAFAMLAFATAVGVARGARMQLEIALLIVASAPTLFAIGLYLIARRGRRNDEHGNRASGNGDRGQEG